MKGSAEFIPGGKCLILMLLLTSIAIHANGQQAMDLEIAMDSPQLFAPGFISTGMYERDLAISPDGNEIIYTFGDYKQLHRCLVSISRTTEGWSEQRILPFSGEYHDIEPFFTADGGTLYFASTRPMPGTKDREDYNIWKVTRSNGAWQDPVALDTLINTPGGEYYPSVSGNGNLYFTATRAEGIGKEDIYVSRFVDGAYQRPEALDTNINSSTYEFNAYVSPDEKILIFSSYGRGDDLGGGDLYLSWRQPHGGWGPARHLEAPINSNKLDYCPFIDVTHGIFYFTSERLIPGPDRVSTKAAFEARANAPGNGLGDIYQCRIDAILGR